jgi:imidazolonepropionase-like amidohydrolase
VAVLWLGVSMCVRHGVDVIYHASYVTPETIDMLAQAKDKHWV